MKNFLNIFIVLFGLCLSQLSVASGSLASQCYTYSNGHSLAKQHVEAVNAETIFHGKPSHGINVKIGGSYYGLSLEGGNDTRRIPIFDLAKTALLTHSLVNACVDGGWLVGLELLH